jgi:4-amino-4-deoxy-L-arabinose transferase-like glycosyltransferase
MQAVIQTKAMSKARMWTGRIVSALPVLMLGFSAIAKLAKADAVIQGMGHYGYPEHLIRVLGTVELLVSLIYAFPRTSFIGAILMTGYLGGATATNVRIGDPSYVMTVLLGVLAWVGLYLRDSRLHALVNAGIGKYESS